MKNKFKIMGLILLMNIMIFSAKNINAADESILVLSASNTTCNVYAKSDGKQVLTYINPLYQRDVPLLGSTSSYYKIMVSGVEGWISKKGNCFKGNGAKTQKVSSIPYFSFTTGGKSLRGLDVSRYQVVGGKMYFALVYGNYITYEIGYTDVPSGLKNNTIYYSYDGIYYYTNYNTMVGDYKKKQRTNAANKTKPYYDYYQYVPMRSVSKVTSTALDKRLVQKQSNAASKLKETKTFRTNCSGTAKYFTSKYDGYYSNVYKKGSNFINTQGTYQVNAGALYGIMLNESANGTSNLSRHYNNPFGWGAVDSCPNSATRYSSMSSAISQYYSNMSSSYANPASSIGGNGTHLGNKKSGANVKYASDPHWGYKNAYNYRKIDELAGKVDKNRYKIGILNSGKSATDGVLTNERIKVYASASTASSPYYYERNGSSVIILGESGSYYRIQKDSKANAGSVYVPKSRVYVTNTATSGGSSGSSTTVKVEYEKVGSTHYIWGKNNLGQLGNGKTATVAKANRINLNSLLPKGEKIKSVIRYNNTNIYVLTTSGNVYSSGSNVYGQRSYTSKANKFTKTNPFNDKIAAIKISGNRLRLQRTKNKNEYYYVGNNGFNVLTRGYNVKTKYPVRVRFSKSKAVYAYKYSFSGTKHTATYRYKYNSKGKVVERLYRKYSAGKSTSLQRLNYASNGRISYKVEWTYVNGKLKSTSKKKAYRYKTSYKNGKARTTYRQTYSSKGKLSKAVKIKVRK